MKNYITSLHSSKKESILSSFKSIFILIALFFMGLSNVNAQTYSGTETFGPANEYSFNFTIACSADGTSALLTVTFTTAEPIGLVPQIQDGLGGPILPMVTPSPYTYTLSGLTDCDFEFRFYMAWAAGGLFISEYIDVGSLPIYLNFFSANLNRSNFVELNWSTLQEINSSSFIIYRSYDGISWESLNEVPAHGNTNIEMKYSYIDKDIRSNYKNISNLFYRLKMIDKDGSFEYSPIRNVPLIAKENKVQIFPNPVSEQFTIRGDLKLYQIKILNSTGQICHKFDLNGKTQTIDISSLPSGLYFVNVLNRNNKLVEVQKVIIE